ncbi:ABC transporter ATP-binding protein [Salipiger abyssi]|uniref:NitT/TauT family transport system ATP-binding protein n=1 Tax=Salipiger abyssi TaxID=1250539 RepID=A0A1P8UW52_9RHOB|nr:ABC transporter ATP-binding protein [Salipiger abyssi]APZ53619.1 NitT/TauT family transport system ATP-binding protein [Salipiger abyssi]
MIEFENVGQSFPRPDGSRVVVADNINAVIEEGEFVCIIGPSGCGKTTLLHQVAGLNLPQTGEIRVHGRKVTAPGPDRGIVFQKDAVFPWMKVIDNVEYGLACRNVPKGERRRHAMAYLDAVNLADVADAWPKQLSGGMLKRVAIATVFANGAEVLLLDEPFGPLDYLTRRQLHRVLLDLWSNRTEPGGKRRTVLFVTHDIDEALTLADRVLVMDKGRIVKDMRLDQPRPRTDNDLATPDLLEAKHVLLRHLGLEALAGEAV